MKTSLGSGVFLLVSPTILSVRKIKFLSHTHAGEQGMKDPTEANDQTVFGSLPEVSSTGS